MIIHPVYLCLGTNLGNRKANLDRALMLLDSLPDRIVKISSIYETEPWGCSNQIRYYNQIIEMATRCGPEDLLARLQNIELICGRIPATEKNAPRFMDIDILFYEDRVISEGELIIPHPFLHKRRFVLTPLAEIAPGFHHPLWGKTMIQLLDECEDDNKVFKIR